MVSQAKWNPKSLRESKVQRLTKQGEIVELKSTYTTYDAGFELDIFKPVRYNLRQSIEVPTVLTSKRTVLIIPDTQHGFYYDKTGALQTYHDIFALELSLEINRRVKPDQIVFLGDHCDFPDLSQKYLCSPEAKGHMQKTIDSVALFLSQHRDLAPNAQIDYLDSNHAKRLSTIITSLIPAIHNLKVANKHDAHPLMSEPYLLGFDELKINYHGDYPREILWLNKRLACVHGYVAKSKSGGTAQALLDCPHSTITGHIHRQEMLYKTEWLHDGPITKFAGCPGTLSKLTDVPSNTPRHNWQQGVFVVHILNDIDFWVEPVFITNRSTIFRDEYIKV